MLAVRGVLRKGCRTPAAPYVPRIVTYKTFLLFLVLSLTPLPALAKPHNVVPVSCDVLWTAIKDTLGNPNDYNLLMANDNRMRAVFLVGGSLKAYTDYVELSPAPNGCIMKLRMTQIGPDYSDERIFRKKLRKRIAQLQAAQEAMPAQGTAHATE